MTWFKKFVNAVIIGASWACFAIMCGTTIGYIFLKPDATITMESWRFGFGLSVFFGFVAVLNTLIYRPKATHTKE